MAIVPRGFHLINILCGRRENWRLRVKVVRVWNMCSVSTPNDPYATQMVLVYEKGVTIEATVQRHLMSKFSQSVLEGAVSNFGLSRNSGKFRASHHEFKITFNASTKMVATTYFSIPCLGLNLLKTSEIEKTNGRSDLLIDFMGILMAISKEMTLNKEGRQARLMLLDLCDETGNIRCAIFGDMIDAISGFLSNTSIGLPVVIIQLARVNCYKGQVGIQNVMNASKILWNPEWPEAIDFKNGLAVHEVETDVCIGTISERSRPIWLREEFLKMYPRKTMGEMVETREVMPTIFSSFRKAT
ncbi:Nucleic acid-binding, OB-fold [Sesbania bispinosa]|nr:Nucleic acid-binding, OB-fold [Sesbania bispinosa]